MDHVFFEIGTYLALAKAFARATPFALLEPHP